MAVCLMILKLFTSLSLSSKDDDDKKLHSICKRRVETTTFIDQVKSNTVKMSATVLLSNENESFSVERDSKYCSNKVL